MDNSSKKRKYTASNEDIKSKRSKTRTTTIQDMFSRLDVEAGVKKKQRSQNCDTATFSSTRCTKWFLNYAGDENSIDPEGMEKFCEDICIEPENILMLVIAFQLNAKQMGYFTYEEWKKGMSKLQCDTPEKIKQRVEYFRSLLKEPSEFKKIYRYAFDFIKEKDQRCVDIETSRGMLTLLLGGQWSMFSKFHQFLEESKIRVLNRDQWNNILEFSRTIRNDLKNYDADGAWPVMIDEFVEWYIENKNT